MHDDASLGVISLSDSILVSELHCTLSRFISEHTCKQTVTTGWIHESPYVVRLHVLSVVPGHVQQCVAICDTGTTKLHTVAFVSVHMHDIDPTALTGSHRLVSVVSRVMVSMDINDIMPPGFHVSADATGPCDSPVVCGYKEFPLVLNRLQLGLTMGSRYYTLPTSRPTTRYRSPCGLGSTMVVNSIVLIYLDVSQYMVPGDLRAPTHDQVGILCPCSTSLSPSLKGLERYVASGVVCRCYHMGVRSVLQLVCDRLPVSWCVCSLDGTQQSDVCVDGIHCSVCIECYSALEDIIVSSLRHSPHSPSVHYSTLRSVTVSFCTGALMAHGMTVCPGGLLHPTTSVWCHLLHHWYPSMVT